MPMLAEIFVSLCCLAFLALGLFYIAKPQVARGSVLKSGRDSKFVRSGAFLWFVRAVGVIAVLIGFRAILAFSGFLQK